MVVEQVLDTTMTDSTSEELTYFSKLKFSVPTATSQICALPLQHMLDWLLNPNGPPLMEGEEHNIQGHLPHRAFALLAAPKFLYGPGGMPSPQPMIGVRVVFVPPYVQKLSFRDAYFFLNQCVRVGSKPLRRNRWFSYVALSRAPRFLTCSPILCGWIMPLRASLRRHQSKHLFIVSEPSASIG